MTRGFRVAPTADRDIDDQAAYLMEKAGVDLALRFHAAVDATFAAIARMPGGGQKWESDDPRLVGVRVRRIEGFPNLLAFHRIVDDQVEIVRVLHAARDLDSLLER